MIHLVTTREHRYTHQALHREWGIDLEILCYDEVLRRRPRPGTYIFTDLDRLSYWQLDDAAQFYRELKRLGIRALTDPARFLHRFGLLRALNRAGINDFDAYRADELAVPKRWPVFIRKDGGHGAPVSGLIGNEGELEIELARVVAEGAPLASLLIVEYAAEEARPGLYRKLSVFRVGDRTLGYTCVHDHNWLVKYGRPGIAPDELYEEEYHFVRDNPFGEVMMKAFELCGVEYGRVDFGIVNGRPQVYEINSNPSIHLGPVKGATARRNESSALFRKNYLAALAAIDSSPRPALVAKSASLVRSVQIVAPKAMRSLGRRFLPGQIEA